MLTYTPPAANCSHRERGRGWCPTCVQILQDEYKADLEKTQRTFFEMEQTLAKALGGFPTYRDDPKSFPWIDPSDDRVCVGEHTASSLVDMIAGKYKALQEDLGTQERLVKRLCRLMGVEPDSLEETVTRMAKLFVDYRQL